MRDKPCPLCCTDNEKIIFETSDYRIIVAHEEIHIPAFCRVIWNKHVTEMTDLSPAERMDVMNAVFKLEEAMRHVLQPTKMNLASLGNIVPHLHWHVIARFHDDPHYPTPVWTEPHRANIIQLPENWTEQVKDYLNTHLHQ